MKIQIIQKGDRCFLRGMFLGFIPVYWDYYSDQWSLYHYSIDYDDAETIFRRLKDKAKQKKEYKESPAKVLSEADI